VELHRDGAGHLRTTTWTHSKDRFGKIEQLLNGAFISISLLSIILLFRSASFDSRRLGDRYLGSRCSFWFLGGHFDFELQKTTNCRNAMLMLMVARGARQKAADEEKAFENQSAHAARTVHCTVLYCTVQCSMHITSENLREPQMKLHCSYVQFLRRFSTSTR
jgi:hypothetical protein